MLASLLLTSSVLWLLGSLAFDVLRSGYDRPSVLDYLVTMFAMMAVGIAPWLVLPARPKIARVTRTSEGIVVSVGRLKRKIELVAADVTAVSVAHGERGISVAVFDPSGVRFFEVARDVDAAAIVSALGGKEKPASVASFEERSTFAFARAFLSAGIVVAAAIYAFAIFFLENGVLKSRAGLLAVTLAFLLMLERLLAKSVGSQSHLHRPAAYDAHQALHRSAFATESATERKSEIFAEMHADHATLGSLSRGDESVAAWFSRLDAAGKSFQGDGAYRTPAVDRDALWDVLRSNHETTDAKMGAARLLRVGYEENEEALVRVVTDADERVRVAAALEELDDAASHVEALGPLFRAR